MRGSVGVFASGHASRLYVTAAACSNGSRDVATFLPALLVSLLGLPLVLAGMHLALWRWRRHPGPLHQRALPVSGRARAACAVLGVALSYGTCALLYFAAFRLEPSVSSLTVDPLPGGPAHQAGVRPGDRARGIDGQRVDTFQQLTDGIKRGGERVELELERDGQVRRVVVVKHASGKVGLQSRLTTMPLGNAAGQAIEAPGRLVAMYLGRWVAAIMGDEVMNVAGPVALMKRPAGSYLSDLAALLSVVLPKVVLAYLVLLAIDTRARRHYQASLRA
jgi:hypothetical protein